MTGQTVLRFGPYDLKATRPMPGKRHYFKALSRGATLSNPVPIEATIESALVDGAVIVVRGHGVREPAFLIQIIAPDAKALAQGEAELFAECQQPSTLAYRNADGTSAVTVYDVLTATPDHQWDDVEETAIKRSYLLKFKTQPFGRAETETTVAALTTGAGTESTISDGTSATGWTSPNGTVTVSSGKLLIPGPATYDSIVANDDGTYTHYYTVEATRTATAIDFSTTPYLSHEYTPSTAAVGKNLVAAYADGASLLTVADTMLTGGTKRATVYCTDPSATILRFVWQVRRNTTSTTPTDASILLDNVKRAPRSPKASTTGRESLRTVPIAGSARTEVSLEVAHASAGLGDTIVYTSPNLGTGYTPDLRQFLTSGGSTGADPALVSGSVTTLGSTVIFDIPAAALPPGGFALWGRVKAATTDHTRSFDWTATTRIGTTDLGGGQDGRSEPIVLDDTDWVIAFLGHMTLPTTLVAGSSAAVVRLTLSQVAVGGGVGNAAFDQLWLFSKADGAALTILRAGAGTPALGTIHNRVWVDAPTLDFSEQSVWMGTAADRSDRLHAGSIATIDEQHINPAGDLDVFVATSGATDALVSGRYFEKAHTFVLGQAS